MKKKNKSFVITSISKEDIEEAFIDRDGSDDYEKICQTIDELDDVQMGWLASKLADDYINQLFWSSLKIIFEEEFL